MDDFRYISPEMASATNESLASDPTGARISSIEHEVFNLQLSLGLLESEREELVKQRGKIQIKWRDSIKWCLEIDSRNPRFFLKTAAGVYKCIAFKNKVELTPDIKNKISITLSALYKEKVIGRYLYNGMHIYGLKDFFNDTLTDLKEEYKSNLDGLFL